MPGIDGFEVCRRIKEDETKLHIKIIILTVHGTKENREKIMSEGADLFLVKPVGKEMIIINHR